MWVLAAAVLSCCALIFGWWRTHRRLVSLEKNVEQALAEMQAQLKVSENLLPTIPTIGEAPEPMRLARQRIVEATTVFEKSIAEREARIVLTKNSLLQHLPPEASQELLTSRRRLDLVEDFYNQTVQKLNHSATHFPTSWVASLDHIKPRPVIPMDDLKTLDPENP